MDDAFSPYELGLVLLLEQLGQEHPSYGDVLTFQARLLEDIGQTRLYGDTETYRANRAQIAHALNRVALKEIGYSFNELCGFPVSRSQLTSSVDRFLTTMGLPPDMYLHERLANLVMVSLGQLGEQPLAVVMHLAALVVLGLLFADRLVQAEPHCPTRIWACLSIIWLGLALLPLVAGSLPQKRESQLQETFHLSGKQRLALQLEKIFGIYISAYLGQILAVIVWLGLRYLGVWTYLLPAVKAAFWFLMVGVVSLLSYVGAVIATKYWETRLQSEQVMGLQMQNISLALGFPFVIYPGIMIFGLVTLSLWQDSQTGCAIIGLGFVALAWLLGREARRSSRGASISDRQ